jgi:hypothetical protein
MADRPLDLISAVARGDAQREDVVAALKDQGIDSLDLLVEVLSNASSKRAAKPEPFSPIDPRRAASRQKVESVHQVLKLPFMLNGTLYDPADIKRFDGQELHFVGGSAREPILAVDDRELMDRWWQFSHISRMARPMGDEPAKTLTAEGDGDDGIDTMSHGGGGAAGGGGGFPTDWTVEHPPHGVGSGSSTGPVVNDAYFYEDVNYRGDKLYLVRGRAFPDLTEIPWTFFGTGDWNDTVSSVMAHGLDAVLYEHVHYAGSTFTAQAYYPDLVPYGWNDRASAIATF